MMKMIAAKLRSLKTRIILTLSVFSFVLTITFSGMIIISTTFAQDHVFNTEVKNITKSVLAQYERGTHHDFIVPEHFSVSVGTENFSKEFTELLQLDTFPPGLYESQTPFDYHYTITNLPETEQRLFVLYNVENFEIPLSAESVQLVVILIPAVVTAALGVFIGMLLADNVISPVRKLAERVRKADPNQPMINLANEFTEDEIGKLAETIEAYSKRISQFIVREKEFTRNVSHELRTPLAVIKNGVELLQTRQNSKYEPEYAALARIDRAVLEMERLVTTFLMLAREIDMTELSTDCKVAEYVDKIVTKYSYMLSGKTIQCKVLEKDQLILQVPAILLEIILGNLIRNAFLYASNGCIVIDLSKTSITITNRFSQEEAQQETDPMTHGIGHSITARLCEHVGYRFTFRKDESDAIATITFHD